ncbi:hypothetical protein RND81_03G118600 [Saponaria officinalis]|uniref:Uncharacterized protein n=1 Tax=Saponaria officinalis TaxID=3572 RepID=A0AAW1M6C3_SAPOF
MKNIVRLTLFFIANIILFMFNKIEANFHVSTLPNKISTIISYNNNNNSSHFMGLSDDFAQYSYINNKNNNKFDEKMKNRSNLMIFNSSYKMEELFFRSTVKSEDCSGVSSNITKSTTLTYVMLGLLLLMMPRGPHDIDMGSDNDNDNDTNNEDTDDDDDDDYDSAEDDVLVYIYDGINNNNNNNNNNNFGFVTNVTCAINWKEVADSLSDDFTIVYNTGVNSVNDGNPRLCCYGYYARYFRYANPQSENDSGEPIQEFSPEIHDWLFHVKPFINRINLYRVYCNGF